MLATKARQFARLATPMLRMNQMIARPSVNSMLFTQARTFASFDQVEKAAKKLDNALSEEMKYENENYTQLEDIDTFLNESGFKFTESDSKIEMTLTKVVGDKTVVVQFDAR